MQCHKPKKGNKNIRKVQTQSEKKKEKGLPLKYTAKQIINLLKTVANKIGSLS